MVEGISSEVYNERYGMWRGLVWRGRGPDKYMYLLCRAFEMKGLNNICKIDFIITVVQIA